MTRDFEEEQSSPKSTHLKQKVMRQHNKNLNVISVIHENGEITEVKTYDGKYSGVYALTMFLCDHYDRDFHNEKDLEWAKKKIIIGMSKKTCFFYEGKDVYSCVAPELRLVTEGINPELEFATAN